MPGRGENHRAAPEGSTRVAPLRVGCATLGGPPQGRAREEAAVANGGGLLVRPAPVPAGSPRSLPALPPPPRPPAGPDMASRRVRRNRGIVLLVLLALVAGLWLSLGRGHSGNAAPPPQPHHHHRAPLTPGPIPGSTPIGKVMEN